MKYVILEASGRQFWAEAGKFIEVNHLAIKKGTKILVRRVLFGRNEEKILIGKPYLNQVKVEACVGKNLLGPKILVYKMKPKKKYRRKNGHRQQLTRVMIENVSF